MVTFLYGKCPCLYGSIRTRFHSQVTVKNARQKKSQETSMNESREQSRMF